tara:strand:+ start:626 stop:1330 length:705 start_codon:yes stop_codon:yes gene_type:complete
MIDKNNIEILIPTLNEEGNIGETIKNLKSNNYNNITIIDDNSKDDTVKISKELGCNVLKNSNLSRMGFGNSLIKAFQNSKSKYCCIFDGDNSFDPKSLDIMVDKINNKSDFVFCSRYKDNNISEDDTLIRKFGNFFFTKLVNVLFKIGTTDVLFLYVMGKREDFLSLDLNSKDFRICTEILLKCYNNFTCTEILSIERKRKFGKSKVNAALDGFKILMNIFHYYIKSFSNKKLI